MRKYLLIGLITVSCVTAYNKALIYEQRLGYYTSNNKVFNDYVITEIKKTPNGISYQGDINPITLDKVMEKTDKCINIPHNEYIVMIEKGSLSCNSLSLILSLKASNPAGCQEKGFILSDNCPCSWRAGVAYPNKIITTSDLQLLPDAFTRWVVWGQTNNPLEMKSIPDGAPWNIPELRKCLGPWTKPITGELIDGI